MFKKNTEEKNRNSLLKMRNSLLKGRRIFLFLTYQKRETCLHKEPIGDVEGALKI